MGHLASPLSSKPLFLFILGPSACGKSLLALEVAKKLQWPIINCDSIQAYKEVNKGTAKPKAEEFKQVPHLSF